MENATRALLIAAGVLLALIVLSVFIVMYNRITNIFNEQEEIKIQEQLQEFNAKFEAYNKKLMYGVDVITLSNLINQNNQDNPNDEIKLYLTLNNEKICVTQIMLVINNNNSSRADITKENGETANVENFEKLVFECSDIKYGELGKVNEIDIVQANKKSF